MKRTLAIAALLTSACAAPSVEETLMMSEHQSNESVDWRDQVIYQILVDRFHNGDANNDFDVEPGSLSRYHGGDWQGVIDKLDYIEALGATALWISPVVRNVESDAGFSSYHGYWTQDFVRPNPHFGDVKKLRELVDAAHARGILVILDIVTNHVGQLFFYDINGNGRADEWLSGGGTSHTCVQLCQNDPGIVVNGNPVCLDRSMRPEERRALGCQCSSDENLYCQRGVDYFERILEVDPEYDPRGIQGWTSLGFSGPADVRFFDQPQINRTAPQRPPRWIDWPDDKPWFDSPEWYNRRGRVYVWWHEGEGYTRDFIREQETRGDFPGGLKDIDTNHPDAQEALIRAFEFWITVGDFDGFRIDTLKHIDRPEVDINVRGFWGEFADRMRSHAASLGKQNFFMFGEAFDGNDSLLGAYTFPGEDERGNFGRVDSVFYFSQKYRAIDAVFKRQEPTKHMQCLLDSRFGRAQDGFCESSGYAAGPTYYDEPHAASEAGGIGLSPNQVLVNFLDNHDLERFLHSDATKASLHLALLYLLTWDGIPCLYYGTEQRFTGGNDPRNREDMGLGNLLEALPGFDQTNDTYSFVQRLIAIRKEQPSLRRGSVDVLWATERPFGASDHGIFVFARAEENSVIVMFNAAEQQESRTCDPAGNCLQVDLPAGTTLTDVSPYAGPPATVTADQTIDLTIPAQQGRIFVVGN